jgi:hypothetical protein
MSRVSSRRFHPVPDVALIGVWIFMRQMKGGARVFARQEQSQDPDEQITP